MGQKIIVCGGNGAGKSTLARALGIRLGIPYLDVESYYFPDLQADYPYADPRSRDEVCRLLLLDMMAYDSLVLSSVKGDFGTEIERLFTCAVYVDVPKAVRLERVRGRALAQFGQRVLPGGDLYEKQLAFFRMVERRTGYETEDWLKTVTLPVIRVDGTRPVAENTEFLAQMLLIQ